MNIHVWGINYSPEVVGIAPYNQALCEFLHHRGHSVRMVTTFCYYPAWKKLPAENGTLFRTDHLNGVQVHRCWHYVPKKVNPLRRIIHELSFVASSFLRQLFLPRPDLIVVISPPLLLGAAAWLLGLIRRAPFTFHVQDLQPDAAAGLGMLKEGKLLKILRWLEKFAYRKAARVSGISPGMLRAFAAKGTPPDKCLLFPNGVDIPDFWRLPQPGRFRQAHGFAEDDFLVVYSGNLGVKQGLEILIEAAPLAANPKIKFLICGDGAQRQALQAKAARMNLSNFRFLPLQPEPRYRELLVDADLYVISQIPGTGGFFFPSKLLQGLAYARPILAIAGEESELAQAVLTASCGAVVSPVHPEAVARRVESLAESPDILRDFGRAGAKLAKHFEQSALLADFTTALENTLRPQPESAVPCTSRVPAPCLSRPQEALPME